MRIRGLVASNAPKSFVKNHLAVIAPAKNPSGLESLRDLARKGVKLVVADVSVPAGKYTQAMFDALGKNADYGPQLVAAIQSNIVSREENVEAVVAKVRLGEADAGVVYVSDISPEVRTIAIPPAFNQLATYPAAVLNNAPSPALAAGFVQLLLSADGRKTLAKHGFVPVE